MKVIESSPDVMGGASVFGGTRVPVETLMDYLQAGDSIDEFLSDFPTVSREQVMGAFEMARDHFVSASRQ